MKKRSVKALTIKSGPTESGVENTIGPPPFNPIGLWLLPIPILAAVLPYVPLAILYLINRLHNRT